MVIEEDGTDEDAEKLSRVLRNDPGIDDIRHAEAGYDVAKDVWRGSINWILRRGRSEYLINYVRSFPGI